MRLLRSKLGADIAWTMSSFVVLAISGIVINVAVVTLRDAAALGAFNLAYAIYIVGSQVATFGLHYSVMRHAALLEDDPGQRGRLLFTASASALVLGCAAAALMGWGSGLLGELFGSVVAGESIRNAAAGLLLFPLSKVLLGFLNGLRRMKAYAALQSTRYVFIMIWVTAVSASAAPFETATYGFVVAEVVTLGGAAVYLGLRGLLAQQAFDWTWLKRHLQFGGKSLLMGIFAEMNSRVDVLLVGYFLSDRAVGIYSFAAMLVDGIYHVLAVVRVNLNPVLAPAVKDRSWHSITAMLRRSQRIVYPAAAALAIALVAAFWLITTTLVPEKGLQEGIVSLIILTSALTLISAYVPFDNLLMVSGRPGYQAVQQLCVVLANVVLCLLLTPAYGIAGAATSTAASYLTGIVVLMLLVRRELGWNMVTNRISV